MNNPVLRVCRLSVKFKLGGKIYPVVQDLSFELKRGKTLAIVGESGCGKSMTAQALLRILPQPPALPPEGEIWYADQNILTLKESVMRQIRGKRIAMIFQDPLSAFNPVYSIGEQLAEAAKIHLNLREDAALQAVSQALEDVHVPSAKAIMRQYPHQLSGGMLQRAMIAMALICSPDILIADEPTTALDVTIQAQILKLLSEIQEKRGMAILLITHDMSVVAHCADDVIVMYGGQQIETGSVNAIFEKPAHPYTQALFASRPEKSLKEKKLASIPGYVPRVTELPQGCLFHPRCRHILEQCKSNPVPTFELQESRHSTKCWLYGDSTSRS